MQGNSESEQTPESYKEILSACVAAANASADIIRREAAHSSALVWEHKSASDFVTHVDRGAESAIAEILMAAYPCAAIIGEELNPDEAVRSSGLAFIVDPLDGTTNFLHGYPEYAVSIGAAIDSETVAAVVLNAASSGLFTATLGGGAWGDGERISVSSESVPARSLIGTGFPFKRQAVPDAYTRQLVRVGSQTAGVRRAGAAALDLADVACGRFDGFWELALAPWDIAAGVLLVREAGGVVTDMEGLPKRISRGAIVAGNPAIHSWLLHELQDSTSSPDI
ncbi:MAG: inositol monophosphatase [Gemmatimonadota bacterium]|nr:inositol monophosphatase [Gemmatimonadota bacterium]